MPRPLVLPFVVMLICEPASGHAAEGEPRARWFVHASGGVAAFDLGQANSDFSSLAWIGTAGKASGPTIGAEGGVRFPLGTLWQLQARGSVEVLPSLASRDCVVWTHSIPFNAYYCNGVTMVLPAVDATLRRPFAATSPFFFGFGPKVGVAYAWGSAPLCDQMCRGSAHVSTVADFFAGLIELGAMVGHAELAVRGFGGMSTNASSGVSLGTSVAAGYVF